ncbi:MAG: baseplate J/gp47 family protein [Myxacorys californica WJT36-NPBG1]|jgi:hypothetical protein|nr:baseplate J/gp47 family protein [Myxacorys californica WJT36-NPBG1]
MSETNFEELTSYIPLIDERNEEQLVTEAQRTAFNKSNGLLNDFSDHNPLTCLIQGQAYSGAELLYSVNKLPLVLLLKFLQTTGVQRNLGSKAVTTLTFTLTAPLTQAFQIPANFEVVSSNGNLNFFTNELLVIPAGSIIGSVSATAGEVGDQYNVESYTLNQYLQPLAFLSSVNNDIKAQGGANSETIEETINRALRALNTRNPVSANDFEELAQTILGNGSRCKAIGLLGSDKITYAPGEVHLFCLDASGSPANPAQIQEVSQSINLKLMLGTQLNVSPMNLVEISGELIIKVLNGVEILPLADELWEIYKSYLSPTKFEVGASVLIQEVQYELRFAKGIKYIEELKLNDASLNIPMPNAYSLPQAFNLYMTFVDEDNNIFTTLKGVGEPS